VATISGDVVGTFQVNVLRFLTRAGGRVALIEAVMVARASRAQGVGTEMMRFAIDEATRLRPCTADESEAKNSRASVL
jgi:GNAT superfamily N-acetyltransferase